MDLFSPTPGQQLDVLCRRILRASQQRPLCSHDVETDGPDGRHVYEVVQRDPPSSGHQGRGRTEKGGRRDFALDAFVRELGQGRASDSQRSHPLQQAPRTSRRPAKTGDRKAASQGGSSARAH